MSNKIDYSGINFRLTMPDHLMHPQPIHQVKTPPKDILVQPRLIVSEVGTDPISRLWTWITDFFKSCFSCFGSFNKTKEAVFSSSQTLIIDPSQHQHNIANPNKQYVYNQLTQGRSLSAQIKINKVSLSHPEGLNDKALFSATKPHLATVQGGFRYDPSDATTMHWTANFADSHLFGFCEGPLLAQDELQVLEHPAIAHLKNGLPEHLRNLGLYDAALLQNVPRYGALDTTTPLVASGQTLYGNHFAEATQPEIQSRLQMLNPATHSNIFAIAAPHISPSLQNQPYQKKDLEALFFTALNAFHGIKDAAQGKKVVIHTGNWGAGAFGNDAKTVNLLQLAAARFAGIDEVRMHPMSQQSDLMAAIQLLNQIEQQNPQMTIGQFLDHLKANAARYQLTYKLGNGT